MFRIRNHKFLGHHEDQRAQVGRNLLQGLEVLLHQPRQLILVRLGDQQDLEHQPYQDQVVLVAQVRPPLQHILVQLDKDHHDLLQAPWHLLILACHHLRPIPVEVRHQGRFKVPLKKLNPSYPLLYLWST